MIKKGLFVQASPSQLTLLVKNALKHYLKTFRTEGYEKVSKQQHLNEIEIFLVHSTAQDIHKILGRENYTNEQIVDILLRHQNLIDKTIHKIYKKSLRHH